MSERAELIVVGGGIVGLATAREFARRHSGAEVVLLEKEDRVAAHQTGRNSGVIHSGIYYKPGSLKANLCRAGIERLTRFCDEHGVAHERCGKVIVAVDEEEAGRLESILERGTANGVGCERIGPERLAELEPHVNGVAAIHVRDAGIVDYKGVCAELVRSIETSGGRVVLNARVVRVEQGSSSVRVWTEDGEQYEAKRLVTCAGLQADRVTKLTGHEPSAKIVPFKGEYFTLKPSARSLVNDLVYPVPDPAFPFLGVHFTRMIERDGQGCQIECGPNAVLALAREGYAKADFDFDDLADTLGYPAFWRIAAKHWKTGASEVWRSVSKAAFARALQRLIPEIAADDLEPAPAGIRAQALSPDGTLVDDFSMVTATGLVNVINAPSPAATASLAIAEHVVDRLEAECV
ncbi:MAG: L-2-hydroxyglutarate oxidase [Phycisphaerales bacterium]